MTWEQVRGLPLSKARFTLRVLAQAFVVHWLYLESCAPQSKVEILIKNIFKACSTFHFKRKYTVIEVDHSSEDKWACKVAHEWSKLPSLSSSPLSSSPSSFWFVYLCSSRWPQVYDVPTPVRNACISHSACFCVLPDLPSLLSLSFFKITFVCICVYMHWCNGTHVEVRGYFWGKLLSLAESTFSFAGSNSLILKGQQWVLSPFTP